MIIKLSGFKKAAEETEGVKYFGPYKGRGFHEGIAITHDDTCCMVNFAFNLLEEANDEDVRDLFECPWHEDNLGRSTIASWGNDYFDIDCDLTPEEDDEDGDW